MVHGQQAKGLGMTQDGPPKKGANPFQIQAPEAMAAFSAAALFTLAVMPPPLSLAGKVSACIFSTALPVLVSGRVFMELSDDETPNSQGVGLPQRLRFWGYTLAIVGLVPFLIELYWLASLAFILSVLVLMTAYLWTTHKDFPSQEQTKKNYAPQHGAASADSESGDGKK
jgi:hypothetical protein